jgi:hypothetical protein
LRLRAKRTEVRQAGEHAALTQADPGSTRFEIQGRQDRPGSGGADGEIFCGPIEEFISVRGDHEWATRNTAMKYDQSAHAVLAPLSVIHPIAHRTYPTFPAVTSVSGEATRRAALTTEADRGGI